ncbi:hypothetical protein LZ31DRAFT_552013 [Colletotrichum somersetense]|nr:hypothetical protein LZ31DRAFT_552013 [Colletotrichum somersetense]
MFRGTYGEAAALQVLIHANLRFLYPFQKTEVVTYKNENNATYASVVCVRSEGELDILIQGEIYEEDPGMTLPTTALENVYYKTLKLLGAKLEKMTPG